MKKLKKLYVITNIEISKDGEPFALCDKPCFENWEGKNKVIWRIMGEKTNEPCNECGA